jgi:hypothetical protein
VSDADEADEDHQLGGQTIDKPLPDLFSHQTADPGSTASDDDESHEFSDDLPAQPSPSTDEAQPSADARDGIPDASDVFDSAGEPATASPDGGDDLQAGNGENVEDKSSGRAGPVRAFFARISGGGNGD